MAQRTISRLHAFSAAVALAVCLLLAPASLRAQTGQLAVDPCKVAGFTPSEEEQIKAFVEPRLAALDQEQAARERARRELLEPLARTCVSVAFRQIYRAAMIERLRQVAASDNEEVAINGLILLGELAEEPARQELQKYTADERLAVRFAAIVGMKRTFRAINIAAPALEARRAAEMIDHLTTRLAEEQDPATIDLIVRTLITAAGITREGYGQASLQATNAVANGIGARLRAASPETHASLLVTTLRVAESLSSQLAGAGSAPAEVSRAGASFAGEVLAHLANLANVGLLPGNRQLETDLTNVCERILVFSHQRLGKPLTPPGLAALLQANKDKEFFSRVQIIVLSLGDAPCSLPAEAMDRIRAALAGN